MLVKGFRFGMLLQLAIGPMCLMVFNTSASKGFSSGFAIVAAITLIDALYIALSGCGITVLLKRKKTNKSIKLLGCMILLLYGIQTILNVFNASILPEVKLFENIKSGNLFLQGLIITASNPLTIVFWSGVFSSQVAEYNIKKLQLFLFAEGCVLSTLVFLTVIAVLGQAAGAFLPDRIIQGLNILVGLFLIYYGFRLVLKKEKDT